MSEPVEIKIRVVVAPGIIALAWDDEDIIDAPCTLAENYSLTPHDVQTVREFTLKLNPDLFQRVPPESEREYGDDKDYYDD